MSGHSCGRKEFMASFYSHRGLEIDMGRGLPRIILQRMDIRILCTSSIQDVRGPGGWSYLIWGLGARPIQKTGKGRTALLIQLQACVEALRELPLYEAALPAGETVKVFTDSDYVIKGIRNKGARQVKDSGMLPECLDRAWGALDFFAARHPIEWFYFDQWLLKEYAGLYREASRHAPDLKKGYLESR